MTTIASAWSYEKATRITSGGYTGWEPRITAEKPALPEGAIRKLQALRAVPQKVFIVTGEHFSVPGRPMATFSDLMLAQNYALSLVNMLLDHVELPQETDASMWENAMEEARKQHAINLGCAPLDGDYDLEVEDDGWVNIDEQVIDGEAV